MGQLAKVETRSKVWHSAGGGWAGERRDCTFISPAMKKRETSDQTVNSVSQRSCRLQKLVAHRVPLNPSKQLVGGLGGGIGIRKGFLTFGEDSV